MRYFYLFLCFVSFLKAQEVPELLTKMEDRFSYKREIFVIPYFTLLVGGGLSVRKDPWELDLNFQANISGTAISLSGSKLFYFSEAKKSYFSSGTGIFYGWFPEKGGVTSITGLIIPLRLGTNRGSFVSDFGVNLCTTIHKKRLVFVPFPVLRLGWKI